MSADPHPAPTGDALHTGGCLCGAVRYQTRGALRGVVICHCSQCRRFNGHYAAYTAVGKDHLAMKLRKPEALRWYQVSDHVRIGYCAWCGSSLFWEREDLDQISVAAGTLDQADDLKTVAHIYTGSAGDYYQLDSIDSELPQYPEGLPKNSS